MTDDRTSGSYLYGIVSADHPLRLGGHEAVGEPSAPLRTVRGGAVTAVVSDAPADLRPKRRDLAAHDAVLRDLCEQGPTLPMRFGVFASDDAAVAEQLAANGDRYESLLAALADTVEYNVKASHVEDAALRAVLSAHTELRERNDALRRRDGGTPDERIELGRQVSDALADLGNRQGAAIQDRLRAVARAESMGEPVGSSFLNVSLLLDRDAVPRFDAVIADLVRDAGEMVDLTVTGPLPPYSFVDQDIAPTDRTAPASGGR